MNPDPREHGPGDVHASSPPPLPTFRHPQAEGLRQRHVHSPLHPPPALPPTAAESQPAPQDMLRLHIQTPYADLGSTHTHTWDAPHGMTVREAKDVIATGQAGYGRWERDGLRLVWRGRILRDEDKLGAVLTDAAPTLHLVARPITPPVPVRAAPKASAPAVHSTPLPATTPAAPVPSSTSTPSAVALADCVHYLLFSTREHLTTLIGAPVIRWNETHPAPTVPRSTAKAAVLSVIRPYAESGGWKGWEEAFAADADDVAALQKLWTTLGRDAVTAEIRHLWKSATGREFSSDGEAADVELDRATYNLHLPALEHMAPSQLVHLLQYLRVTTLLPPLSAYISAAQAPTPAVEPTSTAAPTPTPTTTAPEPPRGLTVRAMARGNVSVRLPQISSALLMHQFWSAARLATIVWMLTRNMGWLDQRLWLLAGAAFGWWVVDGYSQWWAETREQRTRARRAQRRAEAQARLANPRAHRERLQAVARGERAAAAEENPLDPGLMAAGEPESDAEEAPAIGGATARQISAALPLFHLDVEAAQLRLPHAIDAQPPRTAGAPAPPAPSAPALRPPPDAHPSILVTHLLLPVYLWFLTLVPAFEARRARAIRQRERTMRAVLDGLNPRPEGEEEDATPRPFILPDGISKAARRYYARVAERPEGIDWDEEREAQRAMGIPEEEGEAAAGIALL